MICFLRGESTFAILVRACVRRFATFHRQMHERQVEQLQGELAQARAQGGGGEAEKQREMALRESYANELNRIRGELGLQVQGERERVQQLANDLQAFKSQLQDTRQKLHGTQQKLADVEAINEGLKSDLDKANAALSQLRAQGGGGGEDDDKKGSSGFWSMFGR